MKTKTAAFGAALLALMFVTVGVSTSSQATVEQTTTQPEIGSWLYLWYGRNETTGNWSGGWNTSHWSSQDGIVDVPPIGYYSSMDDSTIAWQLQQMHSHGITFVVISFWGVDDYSTPAIEHFLQYVSATNDTMKFAIMIEPHNNINYRTDMNYIASLYGEYSSHVFSWEGKPNDTRFTIRTVGQMDYVDWSYWQGMDAVESYGGSWNMTQVQSYIGNPKIARDGEVTIVPRYDDSALYKAGARPHYMKFDANLTQGLWQKEVTFAKANAKLILVTSFNEYHERTFVEGMPSLLDALTS
jgi:hypothetical protein